MEYTKGPWYIEDIDIGLDDPIYVPLEIYAAGGIPIVSENGGLYAHDPTRYNGKASVEELRGNARIMISSGNMYETLLEVKRRLDILSLDVDGIYELICKTLDDV